jgi:hypothetical protein
MLDSHRLVPPCSVGTVFFSAISLGLAVIALHGAFREPDSLFVDEGEVRQPHGERTQKSCCSCNQRL